jgi:hypothetical protein
MFTAFVLNASLKKELKALPCHLRSEGVNLSHFQRKNMPPFFVATRGGACKAGLMMAVMAVSDGSGGSGGSDCGDDGDVGDVDDA